MSWVTLVAILGYIQLTDGRLRMVAIRDLPTGARGTGGLLPEQCVNTRQVLLISGETQEVHSSKEPHGTSGSETWCPVLSCNVASTLKYRNDLKMPPSLCSISRTLYLLCHLTLLAASNGHSVAFLPSTLQRKQLRSEKSICRS